MALFKALWIIFEPWESTAKKKHGKFCTRERGPTLRVVAMALVNALLITFEPWEVNTQWTQIRKSGEICTMRMKRELYMFNTIVWR